MSGQAISRRSTARGSSARSTGGSCGCRTSCAGGSSRQPPIGADEARAALATAGPGATYARVAGRDERAGAQVLREALVDRATMRARADDRVLVLPDVDAA